MKDFFDDLVGWLFFCLTVYVLMSSAALLWGGLNGATDNEKACKVDSRLEKVFPAHRFGCWLTETLSSEEDAGPYGIIYVPAKRRDTYK